LESLKFTNGNGVELTLEKPYIITKLEGMGVANVDTQYQKAAFQDGQTYLGNTLEPIELTFEMALVADTESELFELRKTINTVFNPKLRKGKLLYTYPLGEKEIECIVSIPPRFAGGHENKTNKMQRVLLTLIAPIPFWLDNFVSGETLGFSIPLFEFDLEIIEDFEFAVDGTNRTNLSNDGDVETPVEIIFNGPAINPIITNETTGEFIKVTQTLLEGECLTIATGFGNKSVIFNDGSTDTNAFGNIDLDSTFWQLQVGDNEVVYSADTGIDTASVNISYTQRYVGV